MFKTLLLVLCSSLLLHQTRSQSLPSTFVEGGRSYRHLDQWVLCIYLPACMVAAPSAHHDEGCHLLTQPANSAGVVGCCYCLRSMHTQMLLLSDQGAVECMQELLGTSPGRKMWTPTHRQVQSCA